MRTEEESDSMRMSEEGRDYIKLMESIYGIYVVPLNDQVEASQNDIDRAQEALDDGHIGRMAMFARVAKSSSIENGARIQRMEEMLSRVHSLPALRSRASDVHEARAYFIRKISANIVIQKRYKSIWKRIYNAMKRTIRAIREAKKLNTREPGRRSTRNVNTKIQEPVDLSYYEDVCKEIM